MELISNFRVHPLPRLAVLMCLLFHQFDISKSAAISNGTLNSEIFDNATSMPTTNSTTRTLINPLPRKLPNKIISPYRPSAIHTLNFYNYYSDYQFIVTAPFSDGIIIVVQDLFMPNGNESVSNGTCPNFIQVTYENSTFGKICGEVKVGDNSSVPSGLIGPRTMIFSGKQIIVNIHGQHNLDHDGRNIRGNLVFTGFTRESRCGVGSYVATKSCSTESENQFSARTHGRQICIASSLFCDKYYNCGASGKETLSYDESSCNNSSIQNTNRITPGSGTGSRPGFPILIPIVYQKPTYNNPSIYKPINTFSSYNSPSNTVYKPSNTFSSYNNYNNVPKYSSGYSGGSTKTVTKSTGKGFKWLIGGVLAILGGIGSLFGCSKKKSDSEQSESNYTPTEQLRRPEVGRNDQELQTSFIQRPQDISPPKYEPDNNLPDEAPPTYQESARAEVGFRVPPR